MTPEDLPCERCDAAPGQPCVMMKCNGFCCASVCDERPHDAELEMATVHQARLRADRARSTKPLDPAP